MLGELRNPAAFFPDVERAPLGVVEEAGPVDDAAVGGGGFEEFFVWRIRTAIPGVSIGVVCKNPHPNNRTSDLRIMGFDAVVFSTNQSEESDTFMISMVYSDSTVKLWKYDSKTWTLARSGNYLTACLTQILSLDTVESAMLLTTATDGHLGIWDGKPAGEHLVWNTRRQIHQDAILAVEVYDLHDGSYLIITGGDDNAVALTRVTARGDLSTLTLPRAHAAAVTGLSISSQSQTQLLLVTTSIDQRVKLWRVDVDTDRPGIDGINVQRLANVSTAVADVSSMALYGFEDGAVGVLVCGVGMDLWRLSSNEIEL